MEHPHEDFILKFATEPAFRQTVRLDPNGYAHTNRINAEWLNNNLESLTVFAGLIQKKACEHFKSRMPETKEIAGEQAVESWTRIIFSSAAAAFGPDFRSLEDAAFPMLARQAEEDSLLYLKSVHRDWARLLVDRRLERLLASANAAPSVAAPAFVILVNNSIVPIVTGNELKKINVQNGENVELFFPIRPSRQIGRIISTLDDINQRLNIAPN